MKAAMRRQQQYISDVSSFLKNMQVTMRHSHDKQFMNAKPLHGGSALMTNDENSGKRYPVSREMEENVWTRPAPRPARWGDMEAAVMNKEEHC